MKNEDLPAFPIRFDKWDKANAVDYYFGLTKLEYAVIEIYKNSVGERESSTDELLRSAQLAKELFKFLKGEASP